MALVCPECAVGKHINCTEYAINPTTDEPGLCMCAACWKPTMPHHNDVDHNGQLATGRDIGIDGNDYTDREGSSDWYDGSYD